MEDNILGFPGYHIAPHTSLTVRSIRRLERLKLKGNTNKYIAKRLNVSNATVGNYLNGKHYKS